MNYLEQLVSLAFETQSSATIKMFDLMKYCESLTHRLFVRSPSSRSKMILGQKKGAQLWLFKLVARLS